MTARRRESLPFYYAGAVIVLALLLGGGTQQGLWTDHLLQIVMLPALFLGLGRLPSSRLSLAAQVLVVLIVVLLVAQFIPFPRSVPIGEGELLSGIGSLSPAPQKSLESALFTLTLLGFFVFLTRLSDHDQERCLRFVLIGFFVNFVAGVLQLSYGQRVTVTDTLPFTITSGLFANENHFSSLVYVMIPLIAYQFIARHRQVWLYLTLAFVIVGFLFAVGSRAGMAIASTLALLSLLWFLPKRISLPAKMGILGAWVAAIIVVSWLLDYDAALEGDLRSIFFATTWQAIRDHLWFGSGLGTFTLVYPAYEARENIVHVYANHAHNDFLELFLETGLIGMLLLGFFLVLILRSFPRSPLAEAAFISVVALFLHSIVDYPLRTMALGVVFAWLAAVILSVKASGAALDETVPSKPTRSRSHRHLEKWGSPAHAFSGSIDAARTPVT